MSIFRTGVVTGGARKNAPCADARPVYGKTEHGPQAIDGAQAKPVERFLQGYPATVVWQGFTPFADAPGYGEGSTQTGQGLARDLAHGLAHGLAGAANSNIPRQTTSLSQNTQPTASHDLPQPIQRRVTVTPALSSMSAYQYPEFQK